MNYEEYLDEAIQFLETSVKQGQKFELKDLFSGVRWNALDSGEKRGFGAYFSRQYKDGRLPMIEKMGETKSHHNKYIKL